MLTTGSITALNASLNTGVATTGSSVHLAAQSDDSLASVQVGGTWTGTLIAQISNNDTDWVTVAQILKVSDLSTAATIVSAAAGLFLFYTGGCPFVRVTASASMTGEARISLRASAADGLDPLLGAVLNRLPPLSSGAIPVFVSGGLALSQPTATSEYIAETAGTSGGASYSIGDLISNTVVIDQSTLPATRTSYWFNVSTGTAFTSSPNIADLNPVSADLQASIGLPTDAAIVDPATAGSLIAKTGGLLTTLGKPSDTTATTDTGNDSLQARSKRVATTATTIATAVAATNTALGTANTSLGNIRTEQATAAKQDTINTTLNAIGTAMATATKQDTSNTALAAILAGQATALKQDTSNTALASILSGLSALATAAKQDTGNASLASLLTDATSSLSFVSELFQRFPHALISGRVAVDALTPGTFGTMTLTEASSIEQSGCVTIPATAGALLSFFITTSGATSPSLSFYGSIDGGNNFPYQIGMTPFGVAAISTEVTAVTSGSATLETNFGNYTHIQARLTALSAGSVVVAWVANPHTKLVKIAGLGTQADTAQIDSTQAGSLIQFAKGLAALTARAQADAGSSSTKAVGVQGVAGGVAIPVSIATQADIVGSGTITTQNTNPTTGTATSTTPAGSTVGNTGLSGAATTTAQITGTYTCVGGLVPQITEDGTNWTNVGVITNDATGVDTTAIPTGAVGSYSWDVAGARQTRLSAAGAVTGTATVTLVTTVANQASATKAGQDAANAILTAIAAQLPASLGQKAAAASLPVINASDQPYPYKIAVGLAGAFTSALSTSQTNILTTDGSWLDMRGFANVIVSVATLSGTTAGTLVFETSPNGVDNVTPVYGALVDTSLTVLSTSATQAFSSNVVRAIWLQGNLGYVRVRPSVSFVNSGGSSTATLTAFAVGSSSQMPLNQLCNLTYLAGSVIAATTAIKSGAKALGVAVGSHLLLVDKAAGSALTSTSATGTGQVSDDYGSSAGFVIVTSAVSGSSPTLDLVLQVSPDDGTSWRDLYHVERITANSTVHVPEMAIEGRRRWVWTIGGSSPSFTVLITSTRTPRSARQIRNFYDRSALTANSTATVGAAFMVAGCSNITLSVLSGTLSVAGQVKLQLSPDGTNWFDASAAVTLVASAIAAVSNTPGMVGTFARWACSTAGTSNVVTYANIHAN